MTPVPVRSYLYVPGDRRDRFVKAMGTTAGAVIVDLEDSVAAGQKDHARTLVAEMLDALEEAPARPEVHVRCNRLGVGWDPADLEVAVHASVATVRLAKAEDPAQVVAYVERLAALEAERDLPVGRIGIDLLIESALGVVRAIELATAVPDRPGRLCLGGADLAADLQVDLTWPDVDSLALARQALVLASRAAGREGPVDTVSTDTVVRNRVYEEAVRARALGFRGKSAIHPRQLDAIHDAFAPAAEEVAWATAIAAAWDQRDPDQGGVTVDGEYVDAPVAARAARVLAEAALHTPEEHGDHHP